MQYNKNSFSYPSKISKNRLCLPCIFWWICFHHPLSDCKRAAPYCHPAASYMSWKVGISGYVVAVFSDMYCCWMTVQCCPLASLLRMVEESTKNL